MGSKSWDVSLLGRSPTLLITHQDNCPNPMWTSQTKANLADLSCPPPTYTGRQSRVLGAGDSGHLPLVSRRLQARFKECSKAET